MSFMCVLALLAISTSATVPTLSHHDASNNAHKKAEKGFFAPPISRGGILEAFRFQDSELQENSTVHRRGALPTLSLYQSYPNALEIDVVGTVMNPIFLNTPAFRNLIKNVCIFLILSLKLDIPVTLFFFLLLVLEQHWHHFL
jgi:hypothetical protein